MSVIQLSVGSVVLLHAVLCCFLNCLVKCVMGIVGGHPVVLEVS